MGLYIPCIEMPKEGNETIIRIKPNGDVLDQHGHHLGREAISVPPRCRLIWDRHVIETLEDAIVAEAKTTGRVRATYDEVAKVVSEVPTIIPAEEDV